MITSFDEWCAAIRDAIEDAGAYCDESTARSITQDLQGSVDETGEDRATSSGWKMTTLQDGEIFCRVKVEIRTRNWFDEPSREWNEVRLELASICAEVSND